MINLSTLKVLGTRLVGNTNLLAKKHGPEIMVAAGVVGLVTTVFMASRATLKLEPIIKDAEENLRIARSLVEKSPTYTEETYRNDVAKIRVKQVLDIGRLYAPSVVLGGLSVVSILGGHIILKKRNLALAAAYKTLSSSFKSYREVVAEEIGEKEEKGLKKVADQKTVAKVENKGLHVNGAPQHSIYARVFDRGNKNWTHSNAGNLAFILSQQQFMNNMLVARGHLFLNDVYDALGFDRTTAGSVVGWVSGPKGVDNFVSFGLYKPDSEEGAAFINGQEEAVWLDFNVDGVVYNLIDDYREIGYGRDC